MLRHSLKNLRNLFCVPTSRKHLYFTELQAKELIAQPNELRDIIIEQIRQMGEMKVTEYWKQALTDQKYGYYRHQNVFSKQGDFITSPQISTLFGQMVATWLVVFLQTPTVNFINPLTNTVEKRFRLVQLGGGRGMLMQDIVRTLHSYKIDNHFDLCFIEISQYNRKEQQKAVLDEFKKNKAYFRFDFEKANSIKEQFVAQNQFKDIKLSWYSRLEELLREDYELKKAGKQVPMTIFVMNQFFDALPITILEYTPQGWRQKVLKIGNNPELPIELSNSQLPIHQKLIPNMDKPEVGDKIEISPESLLHIDMMSKMIRYAGGAILNIDYGGNGPFINSIRAIKNHKYINQPYYWQVPGLCDLSAHVPFSALAQYAQKTDGVKAFELIPQQFFLQAMGIETRMQMLCKTAKKQKADRLQGEVKRLTSPQQMGDTYKVQIISLKDYGEIYPHVTMNNNVF